MPASDIVTINTTLASLGSERPGFGIALVVGEVSAEVAVLFTDRTVVVTKSTFVETLTALGFLATDLIFIACNVLFSQNPTPTSAIVGRRATPVAQISNVAITGSEDGTYSVVINGTSFDFVASGSTPSLIEAGLIALVNGGTEPATASPGSGDDLDLTADEAGVPFTLTVDVVTAPAGNLVPTTPTPNSGLGEDLAAISAENDDWYCVIETSRSAGVIQTGASVVESYSPNRIYMAQSNDALILDPGDATDIGSILQLASFGRTGLWYHDNDSEFADATAAGDSLPTDPGSITWNNREINVTTPPTHTANGISAMMDKSVNYLERIGGRNVTRGGVMASGEFIDVVRGIDWFEANLSADIFDLLVDSDKVGYDDEGGETLKGVVDGRGRNAIAQGVFATFTSTVPKVADQDPVDRATRNFPDVNWEATLKGAVHTVVVNGTVSV